MSPEQNQLIELRTEFKFIKEEFKEMQKELKNISNVGSDIAHIKELLTINLAHTDKFQEKFELRMSAVESKQSWFGAKVSTVTTVLTLFIAAVLNSIFNK